MITTTGRLSFDSGYTTKVSTARPSCFTVTHSWCREDFASFSFAQSCAEAVCPNPKISKIGNILFIFPPHHSAGTPAVILDSLSFFEAPASYPLFLLHSNPHHRPESSGMAPVDAHSH